MLKSFIIITLVVVVTPRAQSSPVNCGIPPDNMHKCLLSPRIFVNPNALGQCKDKQSECERLTCVFKKSGWTDEKGNQVNRENLIDLFHRYAKDHPEWGQAAQYVNTNCLAAELPAQGTYLNCPVYDVVHCALTEFYRNALRSQWSTAAECAPARQYAASCPVCPEDCFAAAIPNGSCNACSAAHRAQRTPTLQPNVSTTPQDWISLFKI